MTPRRVEILAAAIAGEIAAAGGVFAVVSHVSYPTGLYWAVTTASTVGYGDVAPHGGAARVVAIVVMLTAIPLLGALFGLLTSLHVGKRVKAEVKTEVGDAEQRIHRRLDEHHEDMKRHVTASTGGDPGEGH